MTGPHEHFEKTVLVNYASEWEVWKLRFNRGRKLNKPVKFFASCHWKQGSAGALFAGTHWDFPSEKEAEAWFAVCVAEYGGVVHPATRTAYSGHRDR
jgi:hypothetical protein